MSRRHTWFLYVSAAAGAILLLKAVLVIASGDGVNPTVPGVLYLTGLLLALAVAIGAGLRRSGRAAKWAVALGGVFLVVMWVVSLSDGLGGLVSVFSDSEVLADELPIALLGVVLLGVAAVTYRNDSRQKAVAA